MRALTAPRWRRSTPWGRGATPPSEPAMTGAGSSGAPSAASGLAAGEGGTEQSPARAGFVLLTLILVASVANVPLAVANVALPDIGRQFDASQTELNLVAVAYSLGLAGSVLWFGAVAD